MVVGTRPPTLGGDGAVRSALCELEMSRDDELDRFEHHFSYKSTTKYGNGRGKRSSSVPGADAVDAIMQEFDELDELSQDQPQEFYAPLLQRQYFHSRTGAVVLDHEKDYDSDDDVDEEWIIQQSEKVRSPFCGCCLHVLSMLTLSILFPNKLLALHSCSTSLKMLHWKRRSL